MKQLKEERDRLIVEEYLRASNTQESISEATEAPRKTIGDIIKNGENATIGKIAKIWNLDAEDPGYSKERPFRKAQPCT